MKLLLFHSVATAILLHQSLCQKFSSSVPRLSYLFLTDFNTSMCSFAWPNRRPIEQVGGRVDDDDYIVPLTRSPLKAEPCSSVTAAACLFSLSWRFQSTLICSLVSDFYNQIHIDTTHHVMSLLDAAGPAELETSQAPLSDE